MGNQRETEIFSIFGQIEQVAAQMLIDEGLATKIEERALPSALTARFNDLGQRAKFAIVIPRRVIPRFEALIADLRA